MRLGALLLVVWGLFIPCAYSQGLQGFLGGLLGPAAPSESEVGAQADKFASVRPERLKPFFRKLYYEGEWNAVLNSNQLGLAAMSIGEFEIAEKAFDQATERINAVFADDPNAINARKYWSEEGVKDFKGDIHERAMSFFYRGLLFLRSGDYQNASASFLAADFQDTLSASETYQGDFAVMNFLAGWANWCDGNATFSKDRISLAYAVADGGGKGPFFVGMQASTEMPNFLVLSDVGRVAAKYGDGKFKELLKYKPITSESAMPVFIYQGESTAKRIASGIAADIDFQATTRGGRQMDAVLGEKAQFKDDMESASKAAADAALVTATVAAQTGNRDIAGAAGFMALFALGTQIAAQVTTPAADLRAWQSLPRFIGVDAVLLRNPSVSPRLKLGNEGDSVEPVMFGSKGLCGFAWMSNSSSPLEVSSGGVVALGNATLMESGRVEKNKTFRAMLYDRFGAGEKTK